MEGRPRKMPAVCQACPKVPADTAPRPGSSSRSFAWSRRASNVPRGQRGPGKGCGQDLTPSSSLQGLGPFLEGPSQELWCPAARLALLQPIKLLPRPVSVTLWDVP